VLNNALHLTAIPLRSIAAGELGRYAFGNDNGASQFHETYKRHGVQTMLLADQLKQACLIWGIIFLAGITIQPACAERPAPKPSAASLQERMNEMPERAKFCAQRRVNLRCSRGDLVDPNSLCSRLDTCVTACETADKPQRPSRAQPRYQQALDQSLAERCSAAYSSVNGN